MSSREDVPLVRNKFKESSNGEELDLNGSEFGSHLYRTVEEEYHKQLIPLSKLRWKFAQHKINRALGIYTDLEVNEKLDLVNRIYSSFLQAMEYHPQASGSSGIIGANHYGIQTEENLSPLDRQNAEDMVIIAVECLYEIKIYDWTVFNPINFQIITMCEHALHYFSESTAIFSWLLKMYIKMGLTSLATDLCRAFPLQESDTLGFERLGAQRFSVYSSFGMHDDLAELIEQYQDFYKNKFNENTDNIIELYKSCDFVNIRPLMLKNEKLNIAGFQHALSLARTMQQLQRDVTSRVKIEHVLNKEFDHIDLICENDVAYEKKIGPSTLVN